MHRVIGAGESSCLICLDGSKPPSHAQQSNRKDRREAVFLYVRLVAIGTSLRSQHVGDLVVIGVTTDKYKQWP